jgi:hypothetical protein
MAPRPVVGESLLASPELALVDPWLAAELRRSPDHADHVGLDPHARVEEASATVEAKADDAHVPLVVADDPGEARSDESEHVHEESIIVEVVEQTPERDPQTSSHYPALPSPEPDDDAVDETAAALARIRERLNGDVSPTGEKRLRRGFTIASGTSAVCALGVLALDVQLQVAQLPSWLSF